MLSQILNDYTRKQTASSAHDTAGEAFATLLLAARDDDALRQQILTLVRMPELQRTTLVRSAIREMKTNQESEEFRAAFALLSTPQAAAAAEAALGGGS
ncbi:hypothetical protein [Synoicihabitans lomoniglobus]|nr:hypothetical protein [Opitutaceae bacterium LMO-M01]